MNTPNEPKRYSLSASRGWIFSDRVRESLPEDQADEVTIAWLAVSRRIPGGGWITVWPDQRRAALATNGNSIWGDWVDGRLLPDDDSAPAYDEDGREVPR